MTDDDGVGEAGVRPRSRPTRQVRQQVAPCLREIVLEVSEMMQKLADPFA